MFVQLQKDFLGKKPGERIDVDKEHAEKLIELGVATVVSDDLITPAVSKALEGAFGKFTQALDGIIDQSLKQFANATGTNHETHETHEKKTKRKESSEDGMLLGFVFRVFRLFRGFFRMNPALQQFLNNALAALQQAMSQPQPAPAPQPSPVSPVTPAQPSQPSSSPMPLYKHPILHNLLQQAIPLLLQAAPLLMHGA